MGQDEDYEFEERAAIREYDGGDPRGRAEFFAREEIAARKAQDGIAARRAKGLLGNKGCNGILPTCREPGQGSGSNKQKIESLRVHRGIIGKQMRLLKDGAQKDELWRQWMAISEEIIELRKDSHDGRNDGRVSR